MKKIHLIIFLIGLTIQFSIAYAQNIPFEKTAMLTDIDGNTYKTIKIGTQVWLAENLRVTKYRNGKAIPNVLGTANDNLVSGAWCYFNNDSLNNVAYGKLYNWYAVKDSRGLCPVGWHVPSDDEWTVLANYLGGDSVAGGKMKESDTTHWAAPNMYATNASGFTAIPGGFSRDGSFYNYSNAYWWSATKERACCARLRVLYYYYSTPMFRTEYFKSDGIPVRCVKD